MFKKHYLKLVCITICMYVFGVEINRLSVAQNRITYRCMVHLTEVTPYPEMSHTSEDILQFFSNRILHKLTVF